MGVLQFVMIGISLALLTSGFLGGYYYTIILLGLLLLLAIPISSHYSKEGNGRRIVYNLYFKSPLKKNEIRRDLETLIKALSKIGVDYELIFKFRNGRLNVSVSLPRDVKVKDLLEDKLPLILEKLEFRRGVSYDGTSIDVSEAAASIAGLSNVETSSTGGLDLPRGGKTMIVGYTLSGGLVEIPISNLTRHMSIFGATGSGKTNTAARISKELYKLGIPVLILDWHNEYSHILKGLNVEVYTPGSPLKPLKINPLPQHGNGRDLDVLETISILEEALELTPSQSFYLEEGVKKLLEFGYNLTLENVVKSLDYRLDDSYSGREARTALLRKLYLLTSGPTRYMFGEEEFPEFTSGKTYVIELAHIKSLSLRRLYTLILLKKISQRFEEEGVTDDVRLVIVLDEAQNVLGLSESNIASRMLSEVRKYGVGLIVVTQSPSAISPQVLKNCSTKVIHSIRSNLDLKVIGDSTSLRKEEIKMLPYLRRGEALIIFPEDPNPILARIFKA